MVFNRIGRDEWMKNSFEVLEQEREMAMATLVEFSENREYYDENKDQELKKAYYQEDSLSRDGLKNLLAVTHKDQLNYSPHRHVYPWVDLQENGKLKSLYSGKGMDPIKAIEEDIRILEVLSSQSEKLENMLVNCEHVVPQSWFNKKEPMRGICIICLLVNQAVTAAEATFPTMILRIMSRKWELLVLKRVAANRKKGSSNLNTAKEL